MIPQWPAGPSPLAKASAVAEPSPVFGSDVVVDLLADLDIEFIAFAPGATFRGLHDSLVNYRDDVQIVQCLHEGISVAVAHGYAKAAGKPMAVALHDVVGLQQASMAIYNAWCDRVPVLLLGGSGPADAAKRRPWIDWIHTANVQADQVRNYTKWDDQPASLEAVPEAVLRAHQLAVSEPKGPVYVCLDSEIQERAVLGQPPGPHASQIAKPRPLSASDEDLAMLAEWLIEARSPVAVANGVGRDPAAFAALVELAELTGLGVVDTENDYNKSALNFPMAHPLNVSADQTSAIADADLVIGLEARDLFGVLNTVDTKASTSTSLLTPKARVVHVTTGHLVGGSWTSDHQRLQPLDIHLPAELRSTLRTLVEKVRQSLGSDVAARERSALRVRRISERTRSQRAQWEAHARATATEDEVTWPYLAFVLGELLQADEFVLANGHLGNWVHRLWDIDRPDRYIGDNGGGGLGYGLGASIGVALAQQGSGRFVVNIASDGDSLFTPSALWTIAHLRLPILIVMDNNRAYNNSVEHAEKIARARQRPVERRFIGTAIEDPNVDFAMLARSFGIAAEGPVIDPADLPAALGRAIDVVRDDRRPALVDVVTRRRT